ncbi:MAG: four helix bundle protein [Verrucomicrobia bacterium]|nr:MAG: four helix bundle protein [Verrucomicrobiota bacterium]
MDKVEMQARTKVFALRILKLSEALPHTVSGRTLAGQIVRSATSVAANYRAACRARSKADFIAKLGIVEEESDESQFWLEMIDEAGLLPSERLEALKKEADELTAIVVSSIKTAKRGR